MHVLNRVEKSTVILKPSATNSTNRSLKYFAALALVQISSLRKTWTPYSDKKFIA